MADSKKGMARIKVPRQTTPSPPASPAEPAPGPAPLLSTSHRLMAHVDASRHDSWVTPLAGLLLAFSVISLIIQLLIAFS
ncbi:MAG: hypothetical protein JO015_16010 [Verrucomicrobia bacterium]|nr:hypothetical protein [Verrucomicrobiota bacterium]